MTFCELVGGLLVDEVDVPDNLAQLQEACATLPEPDQAKAKLAIAVCVVARGIFDDSTREPLRALEEIARRQPGAMQEMAAAYEMIRGDAREGEEQC